MFLQPMSRQDDAGGQLLRELEALNQVLYSAGHQNGRSSRKETPSSPYLGSVPSPRRLQEPKSPLLGSRFFQPPSPHLGGRAYQAPPFPYLGSRRDSQVEESPSSNATSYGSPRGRDILLDDQPSSPYLGGRKGGVQAPSPYLGGLDGPQNEPRSPVIISLNGNNGLSFGRSGSRRDGSGKPPLPEPVSPFISARRSVDSAPSPRTQFLRLSEDNPSRSPLSTGGQFAHGLSSPVLRARRSEDSPRMGSRAQEPQSRLGRIEETGRSYYERERGLDQLSRGNGPLSPRTGLPRALDDSPTAVSSFGSLDITEFNLSPAASGIRSPHQRPPLHSRISPLSQSEDLSNMIEVYRLDGGRESIGDRGLQPWHSLGSEKFLPEVSNFPVWLEDNVQFSRQLVASKEKKGLWNWKPFRAIAHIGHQRFNCMFTVHVHGIQGLPAVMNGLRLSVSWKRKDLHTQTIPARVFQGLAEFEETLFLKSVVYGTKDGHKGVKFEPRNFDLAVVAPDIDEHVLGKHRLDLSRLLPKSSEGGDEEDDRSWTTSFKLAGKAKGGVLVVTFGCQLLNKNSEPTNNLSSARFSDSPMVKPMRSYNSLPTSPKESSRGGRPLELIRSPYSPAMSELSNDAEYMKMEHLNLNDDYSPFGNDGGSGHHRFSFGKSSLKGQIRPSFEFQGSPKKLFDDLPATHEAGENLTITSTEAFYETTWDENEASTNKSCEELYEEDDGSEFTVVCQGHEISSIVDTAAPVLEYDDPNAENDNVIGLPDGDTDAEVAMDVTEPQLGVELSEAGEVSSTDIDSKTELSDLGDAVSKPIAPQALESDSDNKALLMVDDADVKFEDRSEGSAIEKEVVNSAKHQEQHGSIVDVPEDKGSGFEEDSEVATDSLSVAAPASNADDVNRRNDFSLDGKAEAEEEDDTSVIFADNKDEENTVVMDFVERNVEVEEMTMKMAVAESHEVDKEMTPNVVDYMNSSVKETKPLTATWLQVKTKQEFDDDYDLVAGEFLSLLRDDVSSVAATSQSGEDSPRALLLQQFEQEALIEGGLDFNFHLPEYAKFRVEGAQEKSPLVSDDMDIPDWDDEYDDEFAAIMEIAEAELQKETQLLQSKARAKLLEDEETKFLMQEWGLNDNAFDRPEVTQDDSLAIVPVLPVPPSWNMLHSHGGGSFPHFEGGGANRQMLFQGPKLVEMFSEKDALGRMAVSGMQDLRL
ncbi:uncharacterized protein [Physcomitrium patens]|uniref:C2 NT-type domain-containing protein n=1 Tax=Physcomitrium patens TaxID=3218 RepID=A0A2K1KNL2_PHYPA|nr:protein PLASTID MOVEMENT IMPAIRED 1-RELATED 1-like [Physcomitrium patens]XP_024373330.1 protein PLASTID MOVEMENT IMPAIRED 1-RELATED 1-like [Physcomitrium patens]XP_024373331.1 protein PLASTID MOVEMENT IMPAIRED 1-RELATED 1-like [Physcomitrium patens]PNR55356.1 hypothetical protein PHYPA_006253 [Physcomitrium patens]|eukprot:XP_024373329.1 protein PLASTID MOVEMENT IMPAIRED 1-RELATED 1-like [Physcomitrella patens]